MNSVSFVQYTGQVPRASKRLLSSESLLELEKNFSYFVSSMTSVHETDELLNTFLTREEKVMVMKRLMLYLMLERGIKTAEIAMVLNLSRQTVYAHKSKFFRTNSTYRKIILKLVRKKKTQKFWSSVEDILYPIVLAGEATRNMKARAKIYNGDFSRPKKR